MYELPSNVTTYVEFATWTNATTFGYFFFLAIIGFWLTIFLTLLGKKREAKDAFLVASFVCTILGFLVRIMSLMTDVQAAVFFFALVGGALWNWLAE
jgi:hypothetical protein